MNASNAKDYLPLVQALAEGKIIQSKVCGGWGDELNIDFTLEAHRYRIKPEPREVWFNRYQFYEDGPYQTKKIALLSGDHGAVQVRYREVIE